MARILIVDDDPDILEIMKLEFEDENYISVDTCKRSEKASLLVKKNDYDMIIVDWRMPVMNGSELIKSLRADGCNSYIIIYTGKGMDSDIAEILENGADYFLMRRGDPNHEFLELKRIINNLSNQ